MKKKKILLLINYFFLDVINIYSCSCGYESYAVDILIDIIFQKIEVLWEKKCLKCKKKNKKYYKEISLGNMNKYLFISIQKINENSNNIY